jgi:cyclic pyranopterin phosphate synthase
MPLQSSHPEPRDQLGRPLRELRISVTDRCNFRCGYCMPKDVFHDGYRFMPRADILSFEEIARLAQIAVRDLGLAKLRLTGGEPLLRRGLPELVRMLAAIPGLCDLALTTNGHLLVEQAPALAGAGLRRVTVSLDALDDATFTRMNGTGSSSVARVLTAIDAADAAGLGPVKINCVVIRGVNEHAVEALARRFRGTGHVVRFIEFMDVGTKNRWDPSRVVSADEIVARVAAIGALDPIAPRTGDGVAERYRYRDGSGEIGVIASVTRPFCGDCSRGRLSADGRLLTCLFADSGFSLREPLRAGASDAELAAAMAGVWRQRNDRYSELRAAQPQARAKRRLEMFQIGG